MKKNLLTVICLSFVVSMCVSNTSLAAEPISAHDILKEKNAQKKLDVEGRREIASQGAPYYRDDFDYDWYLQVHPDVAAIVGTDRDAIWDFYVTIGEPAGWYGRRSKDTFIHVGTFDTARFAQENPDVVAMYGDSYETSAYYYWYYYGRYEGRAGYSTNEEEQASIKAYEIANSITSLDMSDRDKAIAIHDWLCKNVAYDYDNYLAGTIPSASYRISGAINNKKAVCNGYSLTFKCMANAVGLMCDKIVGTVDAGDHAWNRVLINGNWLNIDVTWDDPVPDTGYGIVARWKYCLISDSAMAQDHQWAH